MLCERCHKHAATLRYSEVVNGKVSARSICRTCMDELETDQGTGFEVSGAPTARRARVLKEEADAQVPHRSCPSCGVSLRTVVKTNRVGCRDCYSSFAEGIAEQLRTLHPATRHRGKTPNMSDARDRLRANLQAKRALLRTALKAENYEEAAHVRDEIRALESGLHAPSTGRN